MKELTVPVHVGSSLMGFAQEFWNVRQARDRLVLFQTCSRDGLA